MHRPTPLYAERMTDLRQLRALIAVVDEGTFTDAAIVLRTSQASVSRAVAELERTLGGRLLLRTSRGARPDGARSAGHRARPAGAGRDRADRASGRAAPGPAPGGLRLVGVRSADHADPAAVAGRARIARRSCSRTHRPQGCSRARSISRSSGVRSATSASRPPWSGPRRAMRRSPWTTRWSGAAGCRWPISADARSRSTGPPAPRRPSCGPTGAAPTDLHEVHGMEEWLTVVAAGAGGRHHVRGHRRPVPPARHPLPTRRRRAADRGLAGLVARRPAGRRRGLPPPGLRAVRRGVVSAPSQPFPGRQCLQGSVLRASLLPGQDPYGRPALRPTGAAPGRRPGSTCQRPSCSSVGRLRPCNGSVTGASSLTSQTTASGSLQIRIETSVEPRCRLPRASSSVAAASWAARCADSPVIHSSSFAYATSRWMVSTV